MLVIMCGFVMNIVYIIFIATTDMDFFFAARLVGGFFLTFHLFSTIFFAVRTQRGELIVDAVPCLCCWMIILCIFPMQCLMAFLSVN